MGKVDCVMEAIEIARRLLIGGDLPLEKIAKATGLSLERVRS